MHFGFTKTSNLLGDLGPTKTFPPNLFFSQPQTKMLIKTHLANWRQELPKDHLFVQNLRKRKRKNTKQDFCRLKGPA
jgi:hypothetical protein